MMLRESPINAKLGVGSPRILHKTGQPARPPTSQPTPKADDNVNVFEKIELHMWQPKNSKQNFCKHTTDSTQTTQTSQLFGPLMMANLDMASTDGPDGH
jgi:hypothetical protein